MFKVIYQAGILNRAVNALSQIVSPEGGDGALNEPILPKIEPLALQTATVTTTGMDGLIARI